MNAEGELNQITCSVQGPVVAVSSYEYVLLMSSCVDKNTPPLILRWAKSMEIKSVQTCLKSKYNEFQTNGWCGNLSL